MSRKILVIYSKPSQCHIQRFINIVKYDRYTNRKGERQVEDKNSVIVFKNVSFQYQSDASFTLKDVSLIYLKVSGHLLLVITVLEIYNCQVNDWHRES